VSFREQKATDLIGCVSKQALLQRNIDINSLSHLRHIQQQQFLLLQSLLHRIAFLGQID
jgi:hypothetical protein